MEIVPLLGTADPAVADEGGVGGLAQVGVNVVAALSRLRPDGPYLSFISVSPERVLVDSELCRSFAAGYVRHTLYYIIS